MCGIATISIGRGSRGRIPYKSLRLLTKEMLIELSARGKDASGISVVNDDDVWVFKKPLRPECLVVRPKFDEMLEKIGPTTNFVMIHSRSSSSGSSRDNYNNHPIIADPIIGIHNGTLYNDASLFKQFKNEFDAEGDVDSEVIFRMLNMYLEKGLTPEIAMQTVGRQLVGAFTGAAIDMRHTHRMLMFKFQRDLSILKLSHWDTIIAISEVKFYDIAKSRVGLTVKDTLVSPEDETGLIIDVNEGRITDKLSDFKIPVSDDCKRAGQRWSQYAGCY